MPTEPECTPPFFHRRRKFPGLWPIKELLDMKEEDDEIWYLVEWEPDENDEPYDDSPSWEPEAEPGPRRA